MVARNNVNLNSEEITVGKTFKDKRKFDRKHDGLKEAKREPKREVRKPRHDDDDIIDEYYEDEEY